MGEFKDGCFQPAKWLVYAARAAIVCVALYAISASAQTVGECNAINISYSAVTKAEGNVSLQSPIDHYEVWVSTKIDESDKVVLQNNLALSTRYVPPACPAGTKFYIAALAVDERSAVSARSTMGTIDHSGGTVKLGLVFALAPGNVAASESNDTAIAAQCTQTVVTRCVRNFTQ